MGTATRIIFDSTDFNMRILILNPPAEHTISEYPDSDGDSFIETEDFGYFPPLGALYVLSYLEKNSSGHDLFFKDCVAEQISQADLPGLINAIRPDVVGITSFTISLIDVCLAARAVRTAAPQVHLCLGGHHPIAFPFQAAALPEFDSIVVGEGEKAFTELVTALDTGGDITRIQGVYTAASIAIWKDRTHGDKRFLGSLAVPAAYIDDIDALPPHNLAYIRHIKYRSVVGISGDLATIISSRGCPYKCTFCDVPYKRYRHRSVEHVIAEIEACLDTGYQEFHFYDDLFNITDQKVIEFCDALNRRGLQFPWSFRGRVNKVNRESLVRARQAGCRLISFGVETGTDAGLQNLRKGTTTAKVREVFRWCREIGIKTLADFMIGLPFEKTENDVRKNIAYLIDLDPDYAQFAILCLYPNTAIFEQAVAAGLVSPEKWTQFAAKPTTAFQVDHWNQSFTTPQLVALQKWAYKKYYFRPAYILRSILNTKSPYEFKTKLRGVFKLL